MKAKVSIETLEKLLKVAREVENFSPDGVSESCYEVGDHLVVNNGKEVYLMVEVE